MKPNIGSFGEGMKVIGPKDAVEKTTSSQVVSEYISNPHTIKGYKYDLRVHVLVTCYNPLKIFFFPEGTARFCSEYYTND